jgi:hypothetical protein
MNGLDQLRQQIDACRPGSDDLHLPELAELKAAVASSGEVAAELDRTQRFDQNVTSALYDVPVPAGLLDQLLTSAASPVALAGIEQAIDEGSSAAPAADAPQAATSVANGTRRTWLWRAASIALTAAAVLALGVFFSQGKPREVTAQQLAADISNWFDLAAPGSTALDSGWTKGGALQPGYPLDSAIRGRPKAWRSFKTPAGEAAVVYELLAPEGSRALLFVVTPRANYRVARSPSVVMLSGTTGDLKATAWQRPNGQLYVLVLKGSDVSIGQFLRPTHAA